MKNSYSTYNNSRKLQSYNKSISSDEYSGLVFWNSSGDEKNGIRFSKSEKELISENIRRILKTRKGERINEPDFGSNVQTFLFMPDLYIDDLMAEIKYSIEKFEPRVTVKECTLESNTTQNDEVTIKLDIIINSSSEEETVEVEI